MPRKKKNYHKTTNKPKINSNVSFPPNQANLWDTNTKIPQEELNQYQSQLMQGIIKYENKIPSYQEQINDFKEKVNQIWSLMNNKITKIIDSSIIIDENEDVKFYTETLPLKIKELKSQLLLINPKDEQTIIYFDNENLQHSTVNVVLKEELEKLILANKTWAKELQKLKNNQNINNAHRLLENLSCFNNIFAYFKLRVNDLVPTNNNMPATRLGVKLI